MIILQINLKRNITLSKFDNDPSNCDSEPSGLSTTQSRAVAKSLLEIERTWKEETLFNHSMACGTSSIQVEKADKPLNECNNSCLFLLLFRLRRCRGS